MIDYKQELNREQLEVVQNGDGPCLVLAGAGSGKTRAITYRVAYLLEKGVDPKNILLVTFTNKAANEMIDRVRALTGGQISLPWSGTFHHIGYRLLRQYAPLLGYKNNPAPHLMNNSGNNTGQKNYGAGFSIADSADAVDLLKLCLKGEGIDRQQKRFPSAKVLQGIISYARNADATIETVLDLKYPNWLDLAEIISRLAEDYNKRKRAANVMDFDDLLVNTNLLLSQSTDVREKLSAQFRYVLVDEYQDTNKIQAQIINRLASYHKNILVVGDDAQSIYSFRAADIENILNFSAKGGSASGTEGYPDAKIFYLTTNYRSTPDILNVANNVINNNLNQYQKELKTRLDNFVKPEVHAFADNQEEAGFVADRILELSDSGVPLSALAVLFRAAYHSQALEMELTKRGVPYEYRGGVRFFERAHIKDVLAFLRIFDNLNDEIAWGRVLNMQIGIGPAAAGAIIERVRKLIRPDEIESLTDFLPERAKIGWNDFLQIWERMRREVSATPSALIAAVINSKYKDYLETEYPDYRERLQDLEQLGLFAEREPDLNKFLAEASLQESYSGARAQGAGDGNEDKLVLSTIHQAKGLEWDGVFVLNLSAGQFPSERAVGGRELEEERRLFYVAITRAKKYLYFSYLLAGGFGRWLSGPSLFLQEIEADLLEGGLGTKTVFNNDSEKIVYVAEDEPFPSRPGTSFLSDIDDLGG